MNYVILVEYSMLIPRGTRKRNAEPSSLNNRRFLLDSLRHHELFALLREPFLVALTNLIQLLLIQDKVKLIATQCFQ
jgi:hypothetical protein